MSDESFTVLSYTSLLLSSCSIRRTLIRHKMCMILLLLIISVYAFAGSYASCNCSAHSRQSQFLLLLQSLFFISHKIFQSQDAACRLLAAG